MSNRYVYRRQCETSPYAIPIVWIDIHVIDSHLRQSFGNGWNVNKRLKKVLKSLSLSIKRTIVRSKPVFWKHSSVLVT